MVWLVFWIKYVTSNSISSFPVFLNVTARWTLTIEYSLLIGVSSMATESTFYLSRAGLIRVALLTNRGARLIKVFEHKVPYPDARRLNISNDFPNLYRANVFDPHKNATITALMTMINTAGQLEM